MDSSRVFKLSDKSQHKCILVHRTTLIYMENTELDIMVKCKYVFKLKEVKTHACCKSKRLRSCSGGIVLGNLYRMVMLSGGRRVVTPQKSACVKKDFWKHCWKSSFFGKFTGTILYWESSCHTVWVVSKLHEEFYTEWHDTSEPITGFESDLGLGRIL